MENIHQLNQNSHSSVLLHGSVNVYTFANFLHHWKKIEVAACGKTIDFSQIDDKSFSSGNKLLSVALKQANIFLVTKSAAYNWDLCAAHAILRSMDGEIIDLRKIIDYYEEHRNIDQLDFSQFEIIYNNLKSDKCQPKDYACPPFIAFYRSSDLIDILQLFVVNQIPIE